MTTREIERLYNLLPAMYRERDADHGNALHALVRIVGTQAALLEADIEQLWSDFFIETCRPWVIPYIGELVGNELLYDTRRANGGSTAAELFADLAGTELRPSVGTPVRADVARTISYRRRKGTLPMLEELARDVTGFPAHAVEFFQLLGATQHLENVRPQAHLADVRSVDRMDRVDGAFDETSHTVDVRAVGQLDGWHNVPNVGFFLWRLGSYPLANVPARKGDRSWRFHFSPLGNPTPLFTSGRREAREDALATELDVPAPMRGPLLFEDLRSADATAEHTSLYGAFDQVAGVTPCPDCSFYIVHNDKPVPPSRIECRRLDPWPSARPSGRVIAVDPDRGRIAVGSTFGTTTALDVYFHQGFAADVGGGPYERRNWVVRPQPGFLELSVREGIAKDESKGLFPNVVDALTYWEAQTSRPSAVVTIEDSRTYVLPPSLTLANESRVVIQAADGQRPVLQTDDAGQDSFEVNVDVPSGDPDRGAELTLSGIALEGWIYVSGDLGRLRVLHSTLVPGRRLADDGEPETDDLTLHVEASKSGRRINEQLRVEAAFSITGPLVLPATVAGVWLLDSIVDGIGTTAIRGHKRQGKERPGPELTVERSTILGPVRARALDASDSIFAGTVDTERTQSGCVRFSFVPPGSRTSRRYRCQPDLAVANAIEEARRHDAGVDTSEEDALRDAIEGWLAPVFTDLRYGRPAYAQLHLGCPDEIKAGAEDGAEMGAFNHLKQPQRESNLRIRLQEYLPFGLDPGFIYIT